MKRSNGARLAAKGKNSPAVFLHSAPARQFGKSKSASRTKICENRNPLAESEKKTRRHQGLRATSTGAASGSLVAPNKPGGDRVVIDLFGGKASQNPGAINVDLIAQEGIKASAFKLPFKPNSVDEIIVSNPFIPGSKGMMDFLPETAQALKPGGEFIVNFTKRNKFGKLPNADTLRDLGLEVVQQAGPLLPRFENQVFRLTDGRLIPNSSVLTTILKKSQ
ncbi:MAG: class I SAM-dependent methyltransferase [Ketobacter sp.]|nr:class I SAM-dependent methyltransferase [Ketobacter sp.]